MWRKGEYFISTDPSIIPLQTLNEWFASDELYWAKPLPLDVLQLSLERCLCFGLFHAPNEENINTTKKPTVDFVGIARGVTDYVTFVYITDVYVHSTHQGNGLGRWLVECVGEAIDEMPYLRRSMLFTMDWERSVPFYEKILGMSVQESRKGEGMAMMMRKGKAYPEAIDD
jgi:GNAT superfamily N-acetyltransferase